MRIKHYTLIVAFLAISMGIPLVQGCSDPFDEYGTAGQKCLLGKAGRLSACLSKDLVFEIP